MVRPGGFVEEDEGRIRSSYPLKLPLSIKKAAQRLAKDDGVSLNQWIAAAVAQKVGGVETAADFFKMRAGQASGEGLMKFLGTRHSLTTRRRRSREWTGFIRKLSFPLIHLCMLCLRD